MSELRLLSDKERDRFLSWLEMEAESDKQMIEQTKKLGKHGEIVAKHLTAKMNAKLIVADQLRRTESMTIRGDNEPE